MGELPSTYGCSGLGGVRDRRLCGIEDVWGKESMGQGMSGIVDVWDRECLGKVMCGIGDVWDRGYLG